MRRAALAFAFGLLAVPAFAGTVTDSAGRLVEVPDTVGKPFAAGPPASILVYALKPVACLLGAGNLLAVDTLSRTVARVEAPLGILMAVLGAPFFIWLLARGRRGWT